jgi:CO/xanthine dehydrogenase FAD-binding subunit
LQLGAARRIHEPYRDTSVKAAPFDYHAPPTVDSAVALLQRFESEGIDAKVLAGGQSLMPMLNMRVARPQVLIDLGRIATLDYIRTENGMLAIGAMTSKRAAEDSALVRERQPLFHAATQLIGHRPIRNRGTVGGSFAHADPAAEYPAVALVQDIQMKAQGPHGVRVVPAREFFVTYMTTCLEAAEVLTEVRIPALPPGTGWSIQEFAKRDGDLALAGVVATLRVVKGVCEDVRIAAFGVNATAVRLAVAEAALQGRPPTPENFARSAAAGAEALEEPIADVHATPAYRRQLVRVYTGRCLAEASARAT